MFYFMMVQKRYTFGKIHTFNSEFGSFPGLVTCSVILSRDAGRRQRDDFAQLLANTRIPSVCQAMMFASLGS